MDFWKLLHFSLTVVLISCVNFNAGSEPPGPPREVKVETIDQTSLLVLWKPPDNDGSGDIIGFYIGYKSSDQPYYYYETADYDGNSDGERRFTIRKLKTNTNYTVIVQAYNEVGAGPPSLVTQNTAEGPPNSTPSDTVCSTLTSQSIHVTWSPLTSTKGTVRGYKVEYGPNEELQGFSDEVDATQIVTTADTEVTLTGLRKYRNYIIRVQAFTLGGDGPQSSAIYCLTGEDDPGPPSDIKAFVTSNDSILVSWKPPKEPNGFITAHTLYIHNANEGGLPYKRRTPSFQTMYEAKNLDKNGKYEVWVTASTFREGPPSKTATVVLQDHAPARIASFGETVSVMTNNDLTLPCEAFGIPTPEIQWRINGVRFSPNYRISLLSEDDESSLHIENITRSDAGEYTCLVRNSLGEDSITYTVKVIAPPPPPRIHVSARTTSTITVQLVLQQDRTPPTPIHGYTLHYRYRRPHEEWEQVEISPISTEYTLKGFWCGSEYELYVTAFNSVGDGERSPILRTSTRGSKLIAPPSQRFIDVVSKNSVMLHLNAWNAVHCPIMHYTLMLKTRSQAEWNERDLVTPAEKFEIVSLMPVTWYQLKIIAHNSAGSTEVEYEFYLSDDETASLPTVSLNGPLTTTNDYSHILRTLFTRGASFLFLQRPFYTF